jgi:hypothetical protein
LVTSSQNFGYQIANAAMVDSADKIFFHVVYTVLCNTTPDVKVTTKTPGVKPIKHSYNHFYKTPFYLTETAIIIYIIVYGSFFLFIVIKISNIILDDRNDKYKKFLKKQLTEEIAKNNVQLNADSII